MSIFSKIADTQIPDFNVVYDNYKKEVASNKVIVNNILTSYGVSIDKWGSVFEIPKSTLVALIAIESGGKQVGKNSAGAIGLMQVKEITVRECVSRFKTFTGQSMPTLAYNELKSKAPYLLNLTVNNQNLSSANTRLLEQKLSSDANFNIMIGTLCFRVALDATKVNGTSFLNKAIIAYNTGVYGRIRSKYDNKKVSTLQLFKDTGFQKETRNYLAKSLGKYGFIQVYIDDSLV
jgi:soluble lytic murein transglycosylase-like protein